MPIWFVIYTWHNMPGGFRVKQILFCIPTTFEKFDEEYRKHAHLFNGSVTPYPQCETWMRHDESVLQNFAKIDKDDSKHGFNPDGTFDEEKFNSSVVDYNSSKEWE